MSKKTYALIAIIVAGILWSTAGVAAKTLVADVSPFVVGFWRFFLASLCILPFFLKEKPTWKRMRELVAPSTIAALNVPFYYIGIQSTTANAASLIFAGSPLVTAILSYLIIKEKNTHATWGGIILGLLGVSIVILLPTLNETRIVDGNLVGNLFVTLGMLAWTGYTIWLRRLRTTNHISPIVTTSMHFFVSSILCLLLSVTTHHPLITPAVTTLPYIGTMIYSTVILTLLTYFLFQWAIEHVSATTASFKQYVEAIFAVLVNALFLGEILTPGFVIGGLLVLIGLAIATVSKTGRKKQL